MAEASPARAGEAPITLVLKRVFDAPREKVFDAWIDPRQLGAWMGPRGVRAEAPVLEAKVGGRYRVVMHMDSGQTPAVGGVYREIARPERLVFTWAWEGEHPGGVANHETLVTLTFRDVGGKTEMTMRHDGFENDAARDSHSHGWNGSFDKLGEMLANKAV
jgi:uncharacterized protein YndB with AHSA1/START domain